MKKNKKHSLPLKMFLSLDGDDMVRPECPNASNPFHKCADYCTLRAPETKSHEGNKGVKKVEARRHVDPNCRYASNPYHSCGPYCYEDDGESSSSYSSSSLHQFKGDKSEEVKSRDVDPKCKNASNPYHKCSDYCFGGSSEERKESSKDIAKGKEGVEMKKNVVPNCINASNPFHVCGSYCLPIIPKKGQNKGDVKNEAQSSNCKYASNPFHNCAEFCSTGEKGFVPKKMEKRNVHSHPENVTVKTDEAELSIGAVKVSKEKQISRNSFASCSESSKEHMLLLLRRRVLSF